MSTVEYEVETETLRAMCRMRPVSVQARLWEVTEDSEFVDGVLTSTTTRRIIQSWNLPVDAAADKGVSE